MGSTATWSLIYGIALFDGEEWLVEEAGEYGSLVTNWLSEDDDDPVGAIERRLLASVGFDEVYPGRDGDGRDYFRRKREAKRLLGVEIKHNGSDDFSGYILATSKLEVEWSQTKELDLVELTAEPAREGWDAKLQAAVAALGLTPKQAAPAWLLCASYG